MQNLNNLKFQKLTSQHQGGCFQIMQAAFEQPWENIDFLFQDYHHAVWGASDSNNHIIGFTAVCVTMPEVEILTCAVLPKYQGRGIGKMMIRKLIHTYQQQGMHKIFLDVNVTNTTAINLYQRQGFQHIHTRKAYYNMGDNTRHDAWVMVKQLPPLI